MPGWLEPSTWTPALAVAAFWHVMSTHSLHGVHIADSRPVCDCVDYATRGVLCKHILRILLAAGDRSVIEELRKLIPNPKRYPAARKRQGAA